MKNTVKILALLCALALMLSLAACGGSTEQPQAPAQGGNEPDPNAGAADTGADDGQIVVGDPEPEDTRLDYGWIKFQMPEGYEDAQESDSYLTIRSTENSYHVIKVFREYKGDKTVAEMAAEKLASSDRYTPGETLTINGREWVTVNFTFNDNPSVFFFGEGYDKYYIRVTVFEMTADEPAVQTLLSDIELVPQE
jgi:hypothetical protein